MYLCSSESDKWQVDWNQLFPINPHLLECEVVEDVGRTLFIYKDLVGVVVPHFNANHERIVMRVVEMPGIFLCEPNDRAVNLCYLWDESHQLDVLNHPQVGFSCLLG